MDSALELKQKYQDKLISNVEQAIPYLEQSSLFQNLLIDFEMNNLNLLHRLIQIAEIPFSYYHPKVSSWRDQLAQNTFCEEGFSLNGEKDDLLACYNAMITSVLFELKYENISQLQAGINWILKYQNVDRNRENKWNGKAIHKYGGCMKSTPCYIGIVKSMITLTAAKKRKDLNIEKVQPKLNKGLEYILDHQLYQRKSNSAPITKDITKLTYPFTYKTNLIEILRLLKSNDKLEDQRSSNALEFILKKQKKDGFWRVNSFYKPKFWVDFDLPKQKAEWISFEVKAIVNESGKNT
ncbi:MAG: hypothetical protein MI810_23360 [Flavobacteriales bacterium]|nr:hypothetical protein [Flavobacteriales bacterium]